jgi:predicted SprT family Zn-dependent metalloprotease
MYQITTEHRATITQMVADLITKAATHYDVPIEMPRVTFMDKGTRVAGWARGRDWHVNFHGGFVAKFFEEYIKETIAHEVAHLIDYRFNPETRNTEIVRDRRGNLKRTKRSIHGPTWKWIMRTIFRTTPSRCHNWKLVDAGAQPARTSKSPYTYECNGCREQYQLGVVRHNKIQAGAVFRHKGCRRTHQIVFVCDKRVVERVAAKSLPLVLVQSKNVGVALGLTKSARARIILEEKSAGRTKDELIRMLMTRLDMTKAGASTYYYKYK